MGCFFVLWRSNFTLIRKIKQSLNQRGFLVQTDWLLKKNNWIWGYLILLCLSLIIGVSIHAFNNIFDIEFSSPIIFWPLLLFYVFPIVLFSAWGIIPLTNPPSSSRSKEKTEFLVIIAAYNENKVISNSVGSMMNQSSERSNARIVVAFNGTDNTDQIAKSLGAEVICTPTPGCGKSQAIAYALEKLEPCNHRYVVILDADNLTDLNFLDQMAIAAQDGAIALQGNHQVLLASDNWVSRGLEAGYAASGRLFNPGRSRLLNSALLCGTGFAIREDVFRHLWKKIRTQTEDIELNGLLTMEYQTGVKWVQNANFYDEKPDTIAIAIRQRVRWMVGHFKCMIHYSKELFAYSIRNSDIRAFELSIYYTIPVMVFLSSFWLIFILPISYIVKLNIFPSDPVYSGIISAALLAYIIGMPMCGYIALNAQKNITQKLHRAFYYSFLSSLFALFVWPMSIFLAALMLARKDWMFHTPHRASTLNK
jgi:cellulose synthase/poly-beta-1,6-N-acetylglucosamine synthase-like glycosyltransferase